MHIIAVLLLLILVVDLHPHPGWGIAVDSKGSVYFTDIINRTIWKVDHGNELEAYLTNVWSHSIYIDQNNKLYFENEEFELGNGWISLKKVSPEKHIDYVIKPTKYGDGFNSPNFAIDSLGSVYYFVRDTLFQRDKSGISTPFLKNGLNKPHYFSTQKDGRIYFVDSDGIKRTSPDGRIEIIAANLTVKNPVDNPYPNEKREIFNRIYGITIDDEGNIYYAYHGNSRVNKIDLSGKISEIYYSKGKWYPLGLAWFDNNLFILEEGLSSNAGPQTCRVTLLTSDGEIKIIATIEKISK